MIRSEDSVEAWPKLHQIAGILRQRRPSPALHRHVDGVWTNELHGPAELEIVPDGCIDIYWTGAGLRIAGPNTRITMVAMASACALAGIRFRPGIAARWLGISAAELLNAHPPLEDCWGKRATARLSDALACAGSATMAAAMLERALIERLPGVAPADPMICATVAAAKRRGPPAKSVVRGLIDEFGWSERTLRRRCHEAFGYGPKTLARILRFQRFLRSLAHGRAPLSLLAIEAGYADQAHLAREARRLCGQSPSQLMSKLHA